ncbi:hypothetical protein F0562_007156 [Nyssa sinensis]|uniref:Transcription repressor n=1 Tax=Nyssa sinensis TaxID=561372 RepID=A0A5J5A797_9ASTE|nr:hypothetical protein F0562_007156 [Nyssa sinensis]
MEKQLTQKVSRFFPSSWSCRFGVVSDVIGNPITITQNSRNIRRIKPPSSDIRIYPRMTKPTNPGTAKTYRILKEEAMKVLELKSLHFSTDTEGKTCPPVTPISSLYSKNKETEKPLTIKKSSSSNGGWFSSEEQGQVDGETNTVFSLLSDSAAELVRRKMSTSGRRTSKGRRRRGYSERSEMGHWALEVSASKNDTFNDFRNTRLKTAETRQKTTKDCRRTRMGRDDQFVMETKIHEISEVSASSSDSSYDFENFQSKTTETHHKTIKTIHKTTETGRRNEKGSCQSVPRSEFQESYEIEETLTEYYRNSRSFNQKTTGTPQKSCKTRRRRAHVDQNWELRRCAFIVDGRFEESCALKKTSSNPYSDFRTSMVEMIVEKQIFGAEDLERMLQCFLSLNSSYHHKIIVQVFYEKKN